LVRVNASRTSIREITVELMAKTHRGCDHTLTKENESNQAESTNTECSKKKDMKLGFYIGCRFCWTQENLLKYTCDTKCITQQKLTFAHREKFWLETKTQTRKITGQFLKSGNCDHTLTKENESNQAESTKRLSHVPTELTVVVGPVDLIPGVATSNLDNAAGSFDLERVHPNCQQVAAFAFRSKFAALS